MSDKLNIQKQINDLQDKVWNTTGEEKKARLYEILNLYNELLPLDDDKYSIYDNKARIYTMLNQPEQVEKNHLEALKCNPTSAITWWQLANFYFDKNDYALALNAINNCIQNETFPNEYRNELRSRINLALGNIEESEKDKKIFEDYQAKEKEKWDDPNHYYHYK